MPEEVTFEMDVVKWFYVDQYWTVSLKDPFNTKLPLIQVTPWQRNCFRVKRLMERKIVTTFHKNSFDCYALSTYLMLAQVGILNGLRE